MMDNFVYLFGLLLMVAYLLELCNVMDDFRFLEPQLVL